MNAMDDDMRQAVEERLAARIEKAGRRRAGRERAQRRKAARRAAGLRARHARILARLDQEENPMTTNPYYQVHNGEPLISAAGLALLIGMPVAEVKAEVERQGGAGQVGAMRMPAEWARRGNRVRKECWAALGYEAGMKECLDYLAARAGEGSGS